MTLSGTGPHGGSPENARECGWAEVGRSQRERERESQRSRTASTREPAHFWKISSWKGRVVIKKIKSMAQKMATASTTELLLDLCVFSQETWGH